MSSSFTSSRQHRYPPGSTSPLFSSSLSSTKKRTASPTTTNGGKTDAAAGGGDAGRGGSVSIMFFFVLMALPASFVLFLCARYACERAHARRERRERRERARAALRTRFGVASSSDGNNNNNTSVGSNGLPASANGGVVVRASTIDRLADAVIAEANHHSGYTRRSSSRRRRRAEERSIASYRAEAVRRDLRRAFRTGDFSGYDVSLLRRVLLQDRIQENGGIESEYDEETTNFRIAAENDAFFVAEEPGPASLKTLQSLPRCKINDRKWQRFLAGRLEIENLQTCALCLEDFPQQNHALIVLECEHVFCESCVVQWFRLRASCPTCRRVVFAYSKKDRESVFSLPKPPPVVVVVEKTEEQEQEQQHQEEEEEEEEDVEKAAAHSPA
jgi:hypothetical protein